MSASGTMIAWIMESGWSLIRKKGMIASAEYGWQVLRHGSALSLTANSHGRIGSKTFLKGERQ